ncbi:endospore germination permease [Bacillus sp. Bva_UNVM-123]|uniref:endospore germination permease n=1 Tax=Bacillus sp. Bva_UNVM-123 TaxID=2829798 RepID=UPI00391F9E32
MKISGIQIFWLIFTLEAGNTLLLTVSDTIKIAKQDAWISYLIASALGVMLVFVSSRVGLLYPRQTLIEFSKTILGKWLGNLVVLFYLFQWYSAVGVILSEFSDFTITILLYTTPMWVLNLSMILLIIYVLYVGGIEGIGRCAEVFGPIVFMMLLLLTLLSIPNMDIQKILPIFYDSGFFPIVKGTVMPYSFIGESVIMLMLISFMEQPEKGPKSAVWGVAISSIMISFAVFIVITVFGPSVAAKLRYPAFDTISYISVMNFIQNLEILAVVIWILSVFIKLSVYFFLACYGTAKWLNIKDWRKTILFVVIFTYVVSLIYPVDTLFGVKYTNKIWNPYIIPVNLIGIPILLWLVGSIRKRRSN